METALKKAVHFNKNSFFYNFSLGKEIEFSPPFADPNKNFSHIEKLNLIKNFSHISWLSIAVYLFLVINFVYITPSYLSEKYIFMPIHKGDGLSIALYILFGNSIMNVSFPTDMCLRNNVTPNYDLQHCFLDSNMKVHEANYMSIEENDVMKIELSKFPGNLIMNPLTPPESRPSSAPILENDVLNIDNLRAKTQLLLKNLKELQTHQLIRHINYQLKYLVRYKKKILKIPSHKHKKKKNSYHDELGEDSFNHQEAAVNNKKIAERLHQYLKHQNHVIDPDATESSSESEGGEEYEISERFKINRNLKAYHSWNSIRAELISRSMWILARVATLEQSIKKYVDMCKHYQTMKKSRVYETLGKSEPNRTTIEENSSTQNNPKDYTEDYCARTLPMKKLPKRRLYRISQYEANLQLPLWANSCICWCMNLPMTCILCNGSYDHSNSQIFNHLSPNEQLATLEPSFHPILSLRKDIPTSLYLSSMTSHNNFRFYNTLKKSYTRLKRCPVGRPTSLAQNAANSLLIAAKAHRRGWPLLSMRLNVMQRKRTETTVTSSQQTKQPPTKRRKKRLDQDNDLDELIFPANLVPAPRFEKLVYKDIPIPKWRVLEEFNEDFLLSGKPTEEELTDEAFERRHNPSELTERKKNGAYMGRHLKVNIKSEASSSQGGSNVPLSFPTEVVEEWVVDPYPIREFPLAPEDVLAMVREPPTSPKACFPPDESTASENSNVGSDFDGEREDPNDPEWTVLSNERNKLILTLTRR